MLDELALGLLEPLLLAAAGFGHRPHRFVVPFHGGGLPLREARGAPADSRGGGPAGGSRARVWRASPGATTAQRSTGRTRRGSADPPSFHSISPSPLKS